MYDPKPDDLLSQGVLRAPASCPVQAIIVDRLMKVVSLAQPGKIKMLVEYFRPDHASEAYQLLHDGKIKGRAVITPNG